MINKLVKEGLVEHSPYQGVQLTPAGLEKRARSFVNIDYGKFF